MTVDELIEALSALGDRGREVAVGSDDYANLVDDIIETPDMVILSWEGA